MNPKIFVIGDTASLDQDGRPLSGVAQAAIQQGRYAGKLIRRRIAGQPAPLLSGTSIKAAWLLSEKVSRSCRAQSSKCPGSSPDLPERKFISTFSRNRAFA
jgi:hypothetical protein